MNFGLQDCYIGLLTNIDNSFESHPNYFAGAGLQPAP
jgi:hypothetical protein